MKEDTHERLVDAMASLQAKRQQIDSTREQAAQRAREQLDSMGPAIHTLEQHLQAGKGGILIHRRLRTMLTERRRLEEIVAEHDRRSR